jgi:hypothetical protein
MHLSLLSPIIAIISILSFAEYASADKLLKSSSLNTCQDNSSFTASLFNVELTPDNKTVTFDIVGVSSISGNVSFGIDIIAYGISIYQKNINPCDVGLNGMCPMTNGPLDILSNVQLDQSVVNQIPSIVYGVPDIDVIVKVQINGTDDPTVSLACVEARLSTGQTVNLLGVKWATAAVIGLAVASSAVISGLGHSNTAAHIASYALALFGYFQAVAICGLVAVYLPPIALAWTEDFDWTMGIIRVDFLQNLATWYQKATGGTPATVLNSLTTTSVNVQKRSIDTTVRLLQTAHSILKRTNSGTTATTTGAYTVTGIDRIAFVNNMEATNLFLTGVIFFVIFVILTIIAVALFKGFCELAVKAHWFKSDKFLDFRNGWLVVLKGIMFRIVLIGFPQMTILCLWEFTQVDSPAEVVLAIFFFFGMSATLGWAAVKVILIARRSQQMHKNPAYILYSDPNALNKWGFLYVQFRATAYYYILPILVYIIIKAMFVGFAQSSGVAQAIGLVILEAIALIGASTIRPWMDKSTNSVNIAICAMNFINAIILLLCANPFNMPGIGVSISGVLFFIFNAVFALILLIIIIVVTIISLIKKNPDTRYQPMRDDRASFIKSQTQLTTELDALGATARGGSDIKGHYKPGLDLDDDADSWSSDSIRRQQAPNTTLPPSTANSQQYREPPHSPLDPSVPLFPHGGHSPPRYSDNSSRAAYGGYGNRDSDLPLVQNRSGAASPAPYARSGSTHSNAGQGFRSQNNMSPAPGSRSQNNMRYVYSTV